MAGIRLGGIASGMDTESMIQQLVKAKRVRADRYEKQSTKNEWITEVYNEVNQSLANFILNSRKELGLTDVDYFGNLRKNSIDRVNWVNKAVSSNESVFTATANSMAIQGEYSLIVKKLASNATIAGSSMKGKNVDSSTKLSELSADFETDGKGNFKIDVNGKTVKLNTSMRVSEAMKEIRITTGTNVNFDNGSKMLFISNRDQGSENYVAFGQDANTAKLFTKLGLDSEIFTPGRETVDIKVKENNKEVTKTLYVGAKGEDAEISFNGSEDIKYSSNNITINGINLTLKGVSKEDGGVYEKEKINVTTDTDGIFEKIKGFVDEYNKIMDDLQSRLSEKSYRDFQPLTKLERGELKEEEIKVWEEKARSGLLKDDRVIRNMMSDIRSGLYQDVTSTFDEPGKSQKGAKIGAMYELGITTGNWRDGAKLTIDEAKLKEAIEKDPSKVLSVLFQASDDDRVKINPGDSQATRAKKMEMIKNRKSETGVFVRIMDSINAGMEEIIKHSGTGKDSSLLTRVNGSILTDYKTTQSGVSVLKKQQNSISDYLDNETRKLKEYEESLWKKFTAMEKALAKAQQQGGWIAQQLGGGMQ